MPEPHPYLDPKQCVRPTRDSTLSVADPHVTSADRY
jgi:hypothetical protein